MHPRRLHSLCLQGLVLLAAAPGRAQQPDVLHLPMDQWQMHVGDDPRCAADDAVGCPLQKFSDDVFRYGIEWRRIVITLPSDLLQSHEQLALVVQGQQPVYQVFVNGDFIGG